MQGSGAWDLTLELAEVARTSCESGVAVTGNDTASLPGGECGGGGIGGIGGDDDAEVETNSRWHYDFQGSEAVQLFDVDFNLGRPSDAFLAFSTPNGRVAVLTGRSDQLRSTRLAVATSEGRSAADVIVQNTLEDTSAFYVDIWAYVGEGNFTTPEPTTTSTTVTPSLDEVMVFAMIVDEEEFYSSESGGLADLQQNIVDLAVDYVNPSLQPETCFLFSPAMTCRSENNFELKKNMRNTCKIFNLFFFSQTTLLPDHLCRSRLRLLLGRRSDLHYLLVHQRSPEVDWEQKKILCNTPIPLLLFFFSGVT